MVACFNLLLRNVEAYKFVITQALLLILFLFIDGLISLLPNFDGLPENVASAFDNVSTLLNQANYYFPVDTAFTIITLIVTFEAGIFLYKMINWVINKLRGSG